MSIFSRFKDIITSNLNAMLDKAEDPEKLIKLMIREMEDTLIEIKASCASVMANQTRAERLQNQALQKVESWEEKAALALSKEREDLAREALMEKRNWQSECDQRACEISDLESLIGQYRKDIEQLEEKLTAARQKHRVLIERHRHAQNRKQSQTQIRKVSHIEAEKRFEHLESRIDHMEAEADLVNVKPKPNLEEEFAALKQDKELDEELEALKAKLKES